MKRITALFLILTLIVCSSGLYISYRLNLYSIHQHQKDIILHSDILKNTVITFSFPLNYSQNKNLDIHFIDDDEIMVDGKMYDIINHFKSADSIFVNCISDKIEDDVRAEASNQINEAKGASTQTNFTIFKFSAEPFLFHSAESELHFILRNTIVFSLLNDGKSTVPYTNVPSPPPWSNI